MAWPGTINEKGSEFLCLPLPHYIHYYCMRNLFHTLGQAALPGCTPLPGGSKRSCRSNVPGRWAMALAQLPSYTENPIKEHPTTVDPFNFSGTPKCLTTYPLGTWDTSRCLRQLRQPDVPQTPTCSWQIWCREFHTPLKQRLEGGEISPQCLQWC